MKYLLSIILITCSFLFTDAQYHVIFKLGKYPIQHAGDTIFVSGNFNDWNPANSAFKFLQGNDDISELSIDLPAGNYQYKCTRGSWKKTECQFKGKEQDNHDLSIESDTTITVYIEAWKDDFPVLAKKHTAGKQVHIMDTAFYIPQLDRHRRIWVYLPEGYSKVKKRYPVLYMQDGQNLFDAATSAYGEWGIDECLDTMIRDGKQACIVVGIDNGPERMNEYNPYEFQNFGKGEADQYLTFLAETLKPFIDKKYRTLPDKGNTIIAGSSMGAVLSYYAMLQKPEVFGKAGIFSPAFWTVPKIIPLTDSLAEKINGKFFFYIGEKEGDAFVKDAEDVQELLGEKSSSMIYSVIDPTSAHNEKAWRKWFPEFYTWMMASGFNTVINIKD